MTKWLKVNVSWTKESFIKINAIRGSRVCFSYITNWGELISNAEINLFHIDGKTISWTHPPKEEWYE